MEREEEPQSVGQGAARQDAALAGGRAEMLRKTRAFTDQVAQRPDRGDISAPVKDLEHMGALGLMTACLPVNEGGSALQEPGGQPTLLRLLALIGGADLVLGRLFEGHVNALLLLQTFATETQKARIAADARAGKLFGVWNTGAREVLRLDPEGNGFRYRGVKTFASGAAIVHRPVVTAELPEGGWQMTLPRMDEPGMANAIQMDRSFWSPLGMEASESFEVDFTRGRLEADDLFGAAGDFYRDPLFRGGAIRFAAVHAGAVMRLHAGFAEWLGERGRGDDPYQIARLGETALLAREAALWVDRAGQEAERGLRNDAPKHATERMVEFANAMRVAVERLAANAMRHTTVGVGAHGLLRPHRFGRWIRDLTMYLRQPAPDQTLADVGRAALRNLRMRNEGVWQGLWNDDGSGASMPSAYFDDVYAASSDPWSFESSPYEASKYQASLDALPKARYQNALEIGCSIGVFTRQLATRCESLLGVDVSEKALSVARQRCADLPQVRFQRKQLPAEMPDENFDLIVMSEVGYYWSCDDLKKAADLIAARQERGGHLLLVHLTEFVPDYPLTGDEVHQLWLNSPEWQLLKSERKQRYRLDLLERR